MPNLIQLLGRLTSHREALAEALFIDALRADPVKRRLEKRLNLGSAIVHVARQEWTEDRQARHDLVLRLKDESIFRIELKGDAGFTRRQIQALRKGPAKSRPGSIDCLVVPSRNRLPDSVHRDVRVMEWTDLDSVIKEPDRGSLAQLWLGEDIVAVKQLEQDARAYIEYREAPTGDETWFYLWKVLASLGDRLQGLEFSKIDGGRKPFKGRWHYGANVDISGEALWIGWIFRRPPRGPLQLVLIAEDWGQVLQSGDATIPEWAKVERPSLLLWNAADGQVFDVPEAMRRLTSPMGL